MAKRESQGMQIGLILLVMLSIALMVTTYVFWSQAQKRTAEADELRSSKASSDARLNDFLSQNQTLKQMLGHPPDESLESVQKAYDEDMLLFAQTFPEENRNYRTLPVHLTEALQDRNQKLTEASALELRLKKEVELARADEQKNVAEAKSSLDKAVTEFKGEREKFETDRANLNQQRQAEAKQFQDQRRELTTIRKEAEQKVAALTQNVSALELQNSDKDKKINELQDETFEVPDGAITYVNQRLRTCYLDLGTADQLTRQVSFSVYGVDDNNLANSSPKGKLEVLKILGDHMAEARIVSDSASSPIIPGDVVYSPVWEKGAPNRFALVGFMDINSDTRSDRQLIKNVISMNGGLIDAELTDKGRSTGELTVKTRYVVVGDPPTNTEDASAFDRYSKLLADAQKLGITRISVEKLLADMGYKGSGRMVQLGDTTNYFSGSSLDEPAQKPADEADGSSPFDAE